MDCCRGNRKKSVNTFHRSKKYRTGTIVKGLTTKVITNKYSMSGQTFLSIKQNLKKLEQRKHQIQKHNKYIHVVIIRQLDRIEAKYMNHIDNC